MENETDNKKKGKIVDKTKKGFSLIYRLLIYIPTILLLLSVLFACLSQYVAPTKFMFFAYFGLGFPIILFLCVAWAITLTYLNAWKALLLHSLFLLCLPMAKKTIPFNVSTSSFIMANDSTENNADSTFKVLTYNVEGFSKEKGKSPMEISEYLCYEDADICMIQEFSTQVTDEKYPKAFKKLYQKYPYTTRSNNEKLAWSVAILSKYPILNTEIVTEGNVSNKAIAADIVIKGDTIKAIACHLMSNRITSSDKATIKKIVKGGDPVDDLENAVSTFDSKFLTSYTIRENMARDIARYINKTKYNIVLAGDFNDVPISYTYHKIKGDRLLCAKEEVGVGYNHTFNELPFLFCIDHIMYSKSLECISYFRDKVNYSDHYPSMARFKIKKK
ncbi:MAG: endonuclease/exonuclease/phosphatase family protein [Paludibacteraceae bacterium]|nr:endonuclease/exonuclease/phosphatase family protein [Paludibacteraceae bacterium]